jgi:hypothetical protein
MKCTFSLVEFLCSKDYHVKSGINHYSDMFRLKFAQMLARGL